MITDFKIIPYDKKLIPFFINFNVEWLDSFFDIEAYDLEVLNNCEELIINQGGFIFFGKQENQIIATFALINKGNKSYELSKMAVKKNKRGKGYGNKILQFLVSLGEKNKWKKIYLYSNTKLKNSIYLYRKYNFKEVPLEKKSPYLRANIKMEINYYY